MFYFLTEFESIKDWETLIKMTKTETCFHETQIIMISIFNNFLINRVEVYLLEIRISRQLFHWIHVKHFLKFSFSLLFKSVDISFEFIF